jgi:hypothetical protein
VKNFDDAIVWAKNRNLALHKLTRFCPHEDKYKIGLPDKDQELLDKLQLLDFIEKEKLKSPTLGPNPSQSSMNYKKPAMEIPPINIDRS